MVAQVAEGSGSGFQILVAMPTSVKYYECTHAERLDTVLTASSILWFSLGVGMKPQ